MPRFVRLPRFPLDFDRARLRWISPGPGYVGFRPGQVTLDFVGPGFAAISSGRFLWIMDARAHRSRVVAAARSSQNDARRFRRGE